MLNFVRGEGGVFPRMIQFAIVTNRWVSYDFNFQMFRGKSAVTRKQDKIISEFLAERRG